ncbi:sulfatase [Polaribacter batillariae]|uniref:Sulfatase n=1 Tax=Polaribacter batillariae TaxID=2808900 RepID=A0ABX7STZ6_9FLAO|nr:sulfatase [Polaribacter batillariae]QTD37646.1 sulfatase [Polaribacter batillariae]
MQFLKKYLSAIIIIFTLTSCSSIKKKTPLKNKQNFLFILVDDLGWMDVGYNGSTFYETPNIDALSKNSVQFTNAYASASICSPTRASILTGKHPARLNITDWIPGNDPKNRKLLGPKDLDSLPLNEVTIAEILQKDGYETFFAGKWHLGDEGFFPENQGFKTNIAGNHVGHPPGGYYSPYKNPKLKDGPIGEYLTDRLTNESTSFLDTISYKPFFLYLNYYTVHTPIQANKKYLKKFQDKLKTLKNQEIQQEKEGKGFTTLNQLNPNYASMVYAMDKNIGKLIAKLKEKKLYENTTIIFTSDNGGLATIQKGYLQVAPTSVSPLRAGKGWLYEGGIRVPLLIKPTHFNKENQISNEPVVSHDFYSTITSLAKISLNSNHIVDGKDLSPILKNAKYKLKRKELFWHYPHYHGSGWTPGAAIKQGDWKLIEFYETNTKELYNLRTDIGEKQDLSSSNPEKVKALSLKLHELQQSMQAKQATLNPKYKNEK